MEKFNEASPANIEPFPKNGKTGRARRTANAMVVSVVTVERIPLAPAAPYRLKEKMTYGLGSVH